MDSLAAERSFKVTLQDHMWPAHSGEAAKTSHFYSKLAKFTNGMVKLEALLDALIDLCGLDNDVIVCRSLRILRVVLSHSFCLERTERRDNVVVEEPSLNQTTDSYGSESAKPTNLFFANINKTYDLGYSPFETRSFNLESCSKNVAWNCGPATSCIDWVHVFELMHQIATRNKEEHLRLEAISIMNTILLRSNAHLEREKFGRLLVLPSFSQLLRNEAGFRVQTEAVHLLFLLLNCPKFIIMFCSGYKEETENAVGGNSDANNVSASRGYREILDSLADCVACGGNNIQELKLQRNTIILLAFLASSGRPGFEILLGHRPPKMDNFIGMILRVLILELDKEESESAQPPEIFKERCLLVREALIFLNRLVSNPQYSTPVLRVLTNSRDVACLTIDVANRLSRKGKWLWQSDSVTRQMRESEIVDLARVFKKRVFVYLGDWIS